MELLGCQGWIGHSDRGIARTPGRDAIRDFSLARLLHGCHHIQNACTLTAPQIEGEQLGARN